jgi:hypothetical protein
VIGGPSLGMVLVMAVRVVAEVGDFYTESDAQHGTLSGVFA